jgi:hypothetical protein
VRVLTTKAHQLMILHKCVQRRHLRACPLGASLYAQSALAVAYLKPLSNAIDEHRTIGTVWELRNLFLIAKLKQFTIT